MKPELIRRSDALAKTVKRYRGQPFVWGKVDCMVMFRSHMLAMGRRDLPKLPKYASALEAKRALKGLGFETLEALLDSLCERIAPAAALPGDLILVPGSEGLACLTLSLGEKCFGWHEDAAGATTLIHRQIIGAWRSG